MNRCSNCRNYGSCGCTWDEQIQASRITEAERRRQLEREGRPVIVDHLKGRIK